MGISSLCIYYPLGIGKKEQSEQYIKATTKRGRSRTKYKKYELIPVNLLCAHVFRSLDDYEIFILSYMGIANEIFTLLSTTVAIVITIVKAKKEIK